MEAKIIEILSQYYSSFSNGLVNYIPKIIGAIFVLWIGFKIVNMIERVIEKVMTKRKVNPMLTSFTVSFSNIAFKAGIILIAAWILWVQTSSLVALLAATGFAIGMALSGTLQNFAGGVMILLLKPFKIGHYIDAGWHAGTVKSIWIFNTTLSTTDHKKIIIPNAEISNSPMVNFSATPMRRIDFVIWIGYDDDIDKAKKILSDIAKKDERILQKEPITIGLMELADSSVNFAFRFFVKTENYWPVYFDTLETVKKTFDKKWVSFPFPQRDTHVYHHNEK